MKLNERLNTLPSSRRTEAKIALAFAIFEKKHGVHPTTKPDLFLDEVFGKNMNFAHRVASKTIIEGAKL